MALTLLSKSLPSADLEMRSKSKSTASIHMATGEVTTPLSAECTPDLVL